MKQERPSIDGVFPTKTH